MKFCHADKARIGIRHGPFAIALHERPHGAMFASEIERDAQETGFDEFEKIFRIVTVTLQKEQRFGDDGFAGEHVRRRILALLDRPVMPIVVADKKRRERAGIDQPGRHLP